MKVKLNDFTCLPLPLLYMYYWKLTISRLQMVYSVTQNTEFITALCTLRLSMVPRYTRKFNFSYHSIRKIPPFLVPMCKKLTNDQEHYRQISSNALHPKLK